MPFQSLGLPAPLLQGVQAMGYGDPTPIQLRAIPVVLQGRDLIASAQTGTGKTAAFALPILSRLQKTGKTRCLVLEPTRELAAQVETAFRDFARFTDIRVIALYGGVGYSNQKRALQRGIDIIVATPGRLEDFMQQGAIKLQDIEILVLDEVDRMLDIGFLPVVKRIISKCPQKRQTLFFTATLPPEIQAIAAWALREPDRIEIGVSRTVTTSVTHGIYRISVAQKFDLLQALLAKIDFNSVLIFSRTKHGADKIARRLRDANHSVAVLHANRSQNQRTEALAGFKSGKYEVMVATDIAARGIDVAGVSHVINYDIPQHPEDYVHRIGRTGRAQQVGDAFTLVTQDEDKQLRGIEKFIGQKITELKLEGFDYRAMPAASSGPVKPNPFRSAHQQQKPKRFGGFNQRRFGKPSGGRPGSAPRRPA